MKIYRALAMAGALLVSVPAVAEEASEDADRFFFFQNSSVKREQALVDWDECRDLAGVVQPPAAASIYSPGLAGAAAAGFIQGLVRGAQRRHMLDAAVRKCMNVKGYGRYAMTKDEAKAMYAGGWPQIRERLADRAISDVTNATRLDP